MYIHWCTQFLFPFQLLANENWKVKLICRDQLNSLVTGSMSSSIAKPNGVSSCNIEYFTSNCIYNISLH